MTTSIVLPVPSAQPTAPRAMARLVQAFAYPRRASDYAGLLVPKLMRADTAHARVQARVVGLHDEAPHTRSLELRVGRGWRGHRAGQFVTVYANIDGVWQPRCYSISSSDTQRRTVRITVRATTDGFVSRHLVERVALGERLQISQAAGDFVLSEAARPRLFLTAGSGITPVMGMLASGAHGHDTVHVHYARTPDDVIFGDALRDLAATSGSYRLHMEHTAAGGARFSPEQLAALCPDWEQREVWVCGPQPLLTAAEAHWAAAGRGDALHVERFGLAITAPTDGLAGGRAAFAASGRSADAAADAPLLAVAESADLKPAYGCRMGICHTCDCTLLSGAVRDLRTGTITDTPGVRIQPCVSAAAGDVTLDL